MSLIYISVSSIQGWTRAYTDKKESFCLSSHRIFNLITHFLSVCSEGSYLLYADDPGWLIYPVQEARD